MNLEDYQDLEFPADQPELLVLMRAVQELPIEPEQCPKDQVQLRGLRNMWANQYVRFKADLEKLETEWLNYKASRLGKAPATVLSEWDGKGPCPTCKRHPDDQETLERIAMGDKWLEECE